MNSMEDPSSQGPAELHNDEIAQLGEDADGDISYSSNRTLEYFTQQRNTESGVAGEISQVYASTSQLSNCPNRSSRFTNHTDIGIMNNCNNDQETCTYNCSVVRKASYSVTVERPLSIDEHSSRKQEDDNKREPLKNFPINFEGETCGESKKITGRPNCQTGQKERSFYDATPGITTTNKPKIKVPQANRGEQSGNGAVELIRQQQRVVGFNNQEHLCDQGESGWEQAKSRSFTGINPPTWKWNLLELPGRRSPKLEAGISTQSASVCLHQPNSDLSTVENQSKALSGVDNVNERASLMASNDEQLETRFTDAVMCDDEEECETRQVILPIIGRRGAFPSRICQPGQKERSFYDPRPGVRSTKPEIKVPLTPREQHSIAEFSIHQNGFVLCNDHSDRREREWEPRSSQPFAGINCSTHDSTPCPDPGKDVKGFHAIKDLNCGSHAAQQSNSAFATAKEEPKASPSAGIGGFIYPGPRTQDAAYEKFQNWSQSFGHEMIPTESYNQEGYSGNDPIPDLATTTSINDGGVMNSSNTHDQRVQSLKNSRDLIHKKERKSISLPIQEPNLPLEISTPICDPEESSEPEHRTRSRSSAFADNTQTSQRASESGYTQADGALLKDIDERRPQSNVDQPALPESSFLSPTGSTPVQCTSPSTVVAENRLSPQVSTAIPEQHPKEIDLNDGNGIRSCSQCNDFTEFLFEWNGSQLCEDCRNFNKRRVLGDTSNPSRKSVCCTCKSTRKMRLWIQCTSCSRMFCREGCFLRHNPSCRPKAFNAYDLDSDVAQ